MRLPALVLVAALLGSVTVAPGAQAAETPIATISDGPITIDVLRAPIADRPGKIRMSWDLNGAYPCAEYGGSLQYKAWIGNVDLQQTVLETEEYNVESASLDLELYAGHYLAELDPFQCTWDSGTSSGNTWFVDFMLAKCDPESGVAIATPTYLEGSATVTMPNGAKVPLTADSQIPVGAKITTKNGTRIELRTCYGGAIRIGPATSLTLKPVFFGPLGEKKFSAKLFFGRVWTFLSGILGPGEGFKLETEGAGLGVRGTAFCTTAGKKSGKPWTLLQVAEGTVEFTSKGTGKSVLVHAGQYLDVVGLTGPLKVRTMAPGTEPTAETCSS